MPAASIAFLPEDDSLTAHLSVQVGTRSTEDDKGIFEHSVVEIRADLRQGSSGGPLVVAPGVVGGVIFGESRTSADVGYAIAAPAAMASIGNAAQRTQAVSTGPCG